MQYWDDGLISVSKKNDELYHWGIKGMKWGIRRYQNEDGTLTPAGKKRYIKEYLKASTRYNKEKWAASTSFKKQAQDTVDESIRDPNSEFHKTMRDWGSISNDEYEDHWNKEINEIYNESFTKALNDFAKSNKYHQKMQAMLDEYGARNLNDVQETWTKMENKNETPHPRDLDSEIREVEEYLKNNPDDEIELREIAQMELEDLKRERNS